MAKCVECGGPRKRYAYLWLCDKCMKQVNAELEHETTSKYMYTWLLSELIEAIKEVNNG